MNTTFRLERVLSGLVLGSLIVGSSGCGDLVSGANLKPTVHYRPSADSAAVVKVEAKETEVSTETAVTGGVGTLRGKIEFQGIFTPLAPLYVKGGDVKDSEVCAAVEAPNQSILVKDGGLANGFVYLKKAPKVAGSVPPDAVLVFDQKNCVFKPHAMTVRVGQNVKILNSDGVAHNTHTYGKKNSPTNDVVAMNNTVGVPLIYRQAEQEPISVSCDIHNWMKAYHLPIDHPFAAVSAEDGTFEIKDLPVGKHEFKVWHEVGQLIEKALIVMINPGDNVIAIKVSGAQLGK